VAMFSFGAMGLFVLLGLAGGGGLPLGLPPGPEDPAVANAAPEECLFYLSWAGTAKPDPKSENQLEQLLAEPEVQHLVAEVERRIREGLKKAAAREGPQATAMVDEIADLVKKALTSPAAIYLGKLEIGQRPPPVIQGGAIVGLGDDAAKVRATLEKYAKVLPPGALQEVKVGGESFWSIKPDPEAPTFALGVHGKHFVLGIGEGEAEAIVKRMAGKPPAWLAQVRRQLPVPRPSSVVYVNLNKIGAMIQAAMAEAPFEMPFQVVVRALGLDNFTSLASVSGLDKTGFVSRTLLATERQEGDLLSFLNAKPLEAKDLAPIPRDATLALAMRFDLDGFWEMVFGIMAKIDPGMAQETSEEMGMAERQMGFKLREDLFQTLGDVWCIYNSPGEGGLVVTGLTAVVPLKDPKRAATTHEKLLSLMKQSIDEERGFPQGRRFAQRLDESAFKGQKVYTINVPVNDFPVAPSWCLTGKELIFALFPQNVKAYLARGPEFQSLAAVPEVAETLKSDPGAVAIGYMDTAELFRLTYPVVQIAAKFMTQELQREGIDVDVSLLPSAASIGKHVRPGVTSVRRTKAGIEITSRQSLPGGGVAAAVPLAGSLYWLWAAPRRYEGPSSGSAPGTRPAPAMEEKIEVIEEKAPAEPGPPPKPPRAPAPERKPLELEKSR